MNVLWIFAHPESRSLNGALRDAGLHALDELGHRTRESDLYSMGFNPVLDRAEFDVSSRLLVGAAQQRAYDNGTLPRDIRVEQEKLEWADAVVLQFPLWWFGPPAIMKGWLDRVLVQGFGFGVKDSAGRTRRYGDGGLAGKRGLVVTTVGAREASFGPRGIHGHIDDVLFPLLHATFFYTGMDAVDPYVVYGAGRLDDAGFHAASSELRKRLELLPVQEPIPFRAENSGDYDDALVLRPHLALGRSGLGVHRADVEAS